jgi:hypothetical protein
LLQNRYEALDLMPSQGHASQVSFFKRHHIQNNSVFSFILSDYRPCLGMMR